MNPDTDSETPETTHVATSNPIAYDPTSATACGRICVMATGWVSAIAAGENRRFQDQVDAVGDRS
jgi:hypothetical protein